MRRLSASLFAVTVCVTLVALAQPVGPDAQLLFAGGAIVAMLVIKLFARESSVGRIIVMALGAAIVTRYLVWRLTETLPAPGDGVAFGLAILLLAAELYCVLILTISMVINAKPLQRRNAGVVDATTAPTVDVFIPTYNEDVPILATTVAAAIAMDYPADRRTVWLLDDGGTDQKCGQADASKAAEARRRRATLQALCTELGARYLTRARNEHAKAGNLNNGLAASSAELVVVFDADHAPFRSFLSETVGLFAKDPKLFLVQTPHVFLNPDPVERNLRTFERMPSENEMFYAVTQKGLDAWNASFFCGSAAVLSRAALVGAGGFSGVTITEDCETALELHGRGWTSAYVAKPLIAGLQPETFGAFIGQRSRWCQGMMQIMLLKNPLKQRGLRLIQRIAYLSSMSFWLFAPPRLVFMLAPLLHIFFDVKIFVSTLQEALAYTATYAIASIVMQNHLYGHVRWPWVSELYEYVQGVHLLDALASVIVAPRKPTFNVTDKGVTLERDHLSHLARPFVLVFLVLLAGVATAAWRWAYEPGVTDLMLVVGGWCLFSLTIAGAALGVVTERRQVERAPSLAVSRTGLLQTEGAATRVVIARASIAGCVIRRADGAGPCVDSLDAELRVDPLPGHPQLPPLHLTRAPWNRPGEDVAFAYRDPPIAAYTTIADLMYGDPEAIERFLASRRKPMGILHGSLQFLAWGVSGPVRAGRQGLRDMRHAIAQRRRKAALAPVPAPEPTPAGPVHAHALASADLLKQWSELSRFVADMETRARQEKLG